jgi:hypothetical protein
VLANKRLGRRSRRFFLGRSAITRNGLRLYATDRALSSVARTASGPPHDFSSRDPRLDDLTGLSIGGPTASIPAFAAALPNTNRISTSSP